MSEKETELSPRPRRFRALPEKSEESERKIATSEPSESFNDRDNGKIIKKLEQ